MVMPVTGNAQVTLTYDSSSSGYTNETASNLFDGDTSTKWCCKMPFTRVWVEFKANVACRLKSYTITTANDNASKRGRNPKDWKIYGRNDVGGWTELVSVSNDTKLQDENSTSYEYTLATAIDTQYKYYMWEITANKGGALLRVSEFSITVCQCTETEHEGTLLLKEKRNATCMEVGYTRDFYQCDRCGRCYSDAAGTHAIDLASVTIPAKGHTFNGENGNCSVCGFSHMFSHAGTSADPFQISNTDDLYCFAAWVNGTYTPAEGETAVTHLDACAVLTNDITVNTGVLNADGTLVSDVSGFREWTPIGRGDFSYNGIFNGQGHTISGLYFNNSRRNYVGFFGCTGRYSKISNVGIVDSYFCGFTYVGGVCGHHSYGEISNCYSAGAVSGTTYVGGVCGEHSYGEISNCYSAGAVSGKSGVGGVCGFNNKGNISSCYSAGSVIGSSHVGGVCGSNFSGSTISNCYFDSEKYTGKAVGENNGTSTNNKGKTTAQFASGEVCYLLNGSKSDGTQAWYQNLTPQTGDKHPVLTNSGNNTVYDAPLLCGGINNVGNTYANTETVSIEHILIGEPSFNEEKAIYQKICQREGCGATCYFADSKGLYAAKEEAGAFTANTYVLQDATTYDNQAVFSVNDFTYARTFEDTGWTTWYVPFDLVLTEELCNTYSFSRINNVHRYDDNDDGTPDRTEVEAFNQLAGVTLKANYPYLVKAKTDGNLHMALLLNSVTPAKAEDNECFCQSVDYKYSFTGTYSGLSEVGTGSEDPYSLQSNGEWTHQSEISPMRHYLTVTSRNAAPLSSLARISLVVIGDETLTGTVIPYSQEKRQTETYDLSGRLTHSNPRGIVIRNGKKIIQK